MSPSTNRNRITITQPGKPRLFQSSDLPGWDTVGEVARGSDRGALVRNTQTGRYAMARAGEINNLDQRKVLSALGEWGRQPTAMDDGKRVNVYLECGAKRTFAIGANGLILSRLEE